MSQLETIFEDECIISTPAAPKPKRRITPTLIRTTSDGSYVPAWSLLNGNDLPQTSKLWNEQPNLIAQEGLTLLTPQKSVAVSPSSLSPRSPPPIERKRKRKDFWAATKDSLPNKKHPLNELRDKDPHPYWCECGSTGMCCINID